ncbi:MAG: hypothetical protein PVF82_12800 [Gammaproteobacteria bacterium]|jgi:hypothetical protein
MKGKYFIATLLLIATFAQADEFITRTVLNGKVTLTTPKSFGPMAEDILEKKYPSSRRPTEVLSDSTGGVSIAFNHTQSRIEPGQIKEAHINISQMFHNMYPSAKWLRDETININGRTFMVLELITPALDTQIHNIMYGTSVDNRLLLISFNTTVEQSKQWLPVGKKIMQSITIN